MSKLKNNQLHLVHPFPSFISQLDTSSLQRHRSRCLQRSKSSWKAWPSKVQRSNTDYLEANIVSRARVSEEYSDCKLICGTDEFKLHKIILITQSEYFRSAFKKGAFKVRMLYSRLENEFCPNML